MKMRVTFAKRRYKDKVYETPLVVTSYRDEKGVPRNKTLANLSKLPAFVVDLISRALKVGDVDILSEYVHVSEITHLGAIVIGPVFVVLSLLKQLGIWGVLKARLTTQQFIAVLAIITERVISAKPASVAALQRMYPKGPLAHFLREPKAPQRKTWYKALGALEKEREWILKQLHARSQVPGTLYLYDITSSYFEGKTCPLAKYGYNRDGKKGKLQVVIGIICDQRGCPVWVDVFEGNTVDQVTVKQQLLNLREKLGVEEFTFVGDRGMVTNARIEELEKDGWWESFSYITAMTRQEMMKAVDDTNHPVQLDLFDHHRLVEVEKDGTRYVMCYNPRRKEEDRSTRERLLGLTEEKLACISKNVEAGRIKRKEVILRRVYRWLNRWGMERFFEVCSEDGSFSYQRREDVIERYSRLDGCYVIRANAAAERIATTDLQKRYKDLKHVEQAFRQMKTADIQIRPIRHFHESNVRGYIFACFLAYRVIWEVRHRLAPLLERDPKTNRCEAGSLSEVWHELSLVTAGKYEVKGAVHIKIAPPSPYVQKILRLLQVPTLQTTLSE